MNTLNISKPVVVPIDPTREKEPKKTTEQINKENIELMQNIHKNRTSFCESIGGC